MMKQENLNVLYVHIPFCRRKCPFCSFTVYAGGTDQAGQYLFCLEQEAEKYSHQEIGSVYIGGGTPTLLSENELERLIKFLYKKFFIRKKCEFTIETNPETMSFNKARLLKSLGLNRVSVGAQSFLDRYLKFLGRMHSLDDIQRCFAILKKAGFQNINFDMMYGFPGQSLKDFKKDIDFLLSFDIQHTSFYALTLEPQSKFYVQSIQLPKAELMRTFYIYLVDILEQEKFHQYEVSNFSRSGYDSYHNGAYWSGKNYIGLGLGSHSHFDGLRYWNTSNLFNYLNSIKEKKSVVQGQERLSSQKRLMEAVIFGLRQNQGVDLDDLQSRYQVKLSQQAKCQISIFIEGRFLIIQNNRLCTTLKGRLVLDEISSRLV